MKFGYARVSSLDQSLDLQIDALKQFGCTEIVEEKISGAKKERPVLDSLVEKLRKGDALVVWKLDRLGRSLRHLIDTVMSLQDRGVHFVSIEDNIDTSTPTGRFLFHVFGALAEFERDMISERTKAGLAAARARGRKGGRPKGLSPKAKILADAARTAHRENRPVMDTCNKLGISKSTYYRWVM